MSFIGKEIAQYDLDLTEATIPTIYNNTEGILFPASHQELLEMYMDFNDNDRMLVVWPTGAGKTIGALRIAKRFIDNTASKTALREKNAEAIDIASRSINAPKPSGVKIIGFTDTIFEKELINHPEFGIVTQDDVAETKRLRENNLSTELDKHITSLKRKIRDRQNNGYYELFGNKELFQKLFQDTETGKVPTVGSYNDLLSKIAEKKIVVERLIESFNDSLIICDEIHNVYNKKDNNSYGLAISYILDHTNVKALFISATPISNSQSEIVSVVNLLSGKKTKYTGSDFFDSNGNITKGGKEIIVKETKGKVSYLKNTNANDFPRWEFKGKEITDIPRMKFIKVPISQEHYNIYKSISGEIENDDADEENETNKGFVNDLYLKGMDGTIINTPSELADYSKHVPARNKSRSVSNDVPTDPFGYDKIKGIDIEENFDVETYAPKYFRMIGDLVGIPNGTSSGKAVGKSIIYHNNVKNNGIFFISQILDMYGFTKVGSAPREHAICFNCGAERKTHTNKVSMIDITSEDELLAAIFTKPSIKIRLAGDGNLEKLAVKKKLLRDEKEDNIFWLDREDVCVNFIPRHYDMIWSSSTIGVEKILNEFNSLENATGSKVEIILGSKKIKESLDFKAVRRIFIMARPPSISTLIQIIGRGIRNKSHDQLPKSDRFVEIFIYVHSQKGVLLDELAAYKDRMNNFLKFKELEELLYINSINAFTYPDMLDPEIAKRTYKQVLDTYILEKKKYPMEKSPVEGVEIIKSKKEKFDLLYTKMEIDKIKQIIKSLFIERPLWEYEEMIPAIMSWSKTHFWNTNTAYISRNNIDAALVELLYINDTSFIDVDNEKFTTTFRSVNSSSRIILINNKEYNIVPFVVNKTQYMKLQRVEMLQDLSALTLFNDITDKAQSIVYEEFTLPLRHNDGFDPKNFLDHVSPGDVVFEIDGLLDVEQTAIIVYIVNDLKLFSNEPADIPEVMLEKITRAIFFMIFTGIFVVNMTAPAEKGVAKMLKNVTENIFSIEAGSMSTLERIPLKYHAVVYYLLDWVKKHKTFNGLITPVKIIQKKPYVYRDGKLLESQYAENVIIKENDVVVGYMERDIKTGKKVFKLREPHKKTSEKVDNRKLKKGSFYMNIPRDRLESYIRELEPDFDLSVYTKKEEIGAHLKYLLRQLDKNSTDGVRYFYW